MTKRMLIVGRGALAQAIVPRLQAAGFEAVRLLQVSSEDSPLDVQTLHDVAAVLLVADDGKGFDKDDILDGHPSERNVGLYGMIERTELAGGRLAIRTKPGTGVILRAIL